MFVRVTADPASRPNTLTALGMEERFKSNRQFKRIQLQERNRNIWRKGAGRIRLSGQNWRRRSYKLLSDGRRQIGAFHLAGDIFGLENGSEHRFTAEAIVDTTVRLIKRRSLEMVAETMPWSRETCSA